MKQQEGISQSEYARRHGWSQPYISKLVSQGKISTLPNGRIDPAQADQDLVRNTGSTAHGRNGRSLAEQDDWDSLIVHSWNDFFTSAEQLWRIVPVKKLSREVMLDFIQGLK